MRRLLPVLAVLASALAGGAASASAAPAITAISPNHGKVGTSVTVSGSGFTGATAVWFGTDDYPATSLSVSGDSKLVVKAPSGILAGTQVDVRVVGAGSEESPVVGRDVFTYDTAAVAKHAYEEKGTHGPRQGTFVVRFAGHGTWSSSYSSSFNANGLSGSSKFSEASAYSWDWAMDPKIDQTLLVYPTCGGGGAPNLCKAIGPAVGLSKGKQSLEFTVHDEILDSVDPPRTSSCKDSLALKGGNGAGIGLSIKPSASGKQLQISNIAASPLSPGGSDEFFDTTCKGLDDQALWRPGGDGTAETEVVSNLFAFRVPPIPTRVLQRSDVVTIPVKGPARGNEPKRNCGNTEGASCVQSGGWSGTITFTRVRL